MRARSSLAWVVVLFLLPAFAWAQPLADRIPGDAILYVGWRGTDDMGPGYEGSHLKAVIEAANLSGLLNDYLPRLMQRVTQEDRQAGQIMEIVSALGGTMIKRPTALYFGGVEFPQGQNPSPKLALICDAGKDAPALLQRINDVLAKLPPTPIPVKAEAVGNFVQVYLGDRSLAKYLGETAASTPTLSQTKEFTDALGQVQKDSAGAIYIDAEKALALVDEGMKFDRASPRDMEMWGKVRDGSGLSGIKRLVWTCGFDGKDWSAQGFIAAPAPRTGLVAAWCDTQPVSDEMLKSIPQSATMLMAGRLDLAKLLTEIRTFVGKVEPRAVEELDRGLAMVKQNLGVDVPETLAALGDEWAVYTSPTTGGNGIAGLTLINRLRDAAKTQPALEKLEGIANAALAQEMRREKVKVAMQTTVIGGLTIHYLGVPLVAPGWAIKDNNLYVALYPQVIASAAEAAKGKSILDNPEYQALRKRLGVEKAQGISFLDLPKTAPEGYQTVLALSRLLTGMSDMFGVPAPLVVPPLDKLMPHLSPAGGAGWSDDTGIHFKTISPFPGAEILGSSPNLAIGALPMMAGVTLPALSRAREQAGHVKCGSNLRQIGQSIMMYEAENNSLPPDFAALAKYVGTPTVFVCPSSNDTPAPGQKPEEWAAKLLAGGHCSYVYLGKGLKANQLNAETILVYEHMSNHGRDGNGMNLLFGDGHVEWNAMGQALSRIERQQKRLNEK